MSRRAELTPERLGPLDVIRAPIERARLAARGLRMCEDCGRSIPATASRCRRRRCPGYALTWARDTMRKIRVNLEAYDGLAAMLTLTAPGESVGLVFDRTLCRHPAGERCDGRKGCRVVEPAARLWNDRSRGWWSQLNRVCKQRADRAVSRLGATYKGGVLLYEWELQARGVWHLHFVVGLETDIERHWAYEYVRAMRELGPKYFFGFVDAKPLRSPQPAAQCAGYVSKYLVKRAEDGSFAVTETAQAAGRQLLSYVSLRLTAKTFCTMRMLRLMRVAWAWRSGLIEAPWCDPFEFLAALCLLEQTPAAARAP